MKNIYKLLRNKYNSRLNFGKSKISSQNITFIPNNEAILKFYQRSEINKGSDDSGRQIKEIQSHLGGARISINPKSFCPRLWEELIRITNAKSYVDIGCGLGYSVEYFNSRGINSIGIDGSENAINSSHVKELLKLNDYTKSSVLSKEVDLIWSQEFVEHIRQEESKYFLSDFKKANFIFMTHGLPGQKGTNHVNCKPSLFWIKELSNLGFKFDEQTTLYLRSVAKYEAILSSKLLRRKHRKWAQLTGLFFYK